MTWEYGKAIDGNVALLGELPATQGTLAIGFSDTIVGARTKARSRSAKDVTRYARDSSQAGGSGGKLSTFRIARPTSGEKLICRLSF